MSTKRQGDSCYEKAGLDEPIFVLRAKDALAPDVVRDWAMKAHLHGCPEAKVNEALLLANQMEDWAKLNGGKFPD